LANIPINALKREIERRNYPNPKVKYIMVIIYNKEDVRLSYQLKGEMADLWQSVCGKTESQNLTSRDAALRELEEETDLIAIREDLQFLFNDNNFDCDVYKLKVHPRMELNQPNTDLGNTSVRGLFMTCLRKAINPNLHYS